MEKDILRKLKFHFNLPIAYVFMLRFLKAYQLETKQLEHLAFYLLQLCLVEYEALSSKPSMICDATLYLLVCHARCQESLIRDYAEMILRFHKVAKGGQLFKSMSKE